MLSYITRIFRNILTVYMYLAKTEKHVFVINNIPEVFRNGNILTTTL